MCLSFFPIGVFDEILNLIESVSEGFPSYSAVKHFFGRYFALKGSNFSAFIYHDFFIIFVLDAIVIIMYNNAVEVKDFSKTFFIVFFLYYLVLFT